MQSAPDTIRTCDLCLRSEAPPRQWPNGRMAGAPIDKSTTACDLALRFLGGGRRLEARGSVGRSWGMVRSTCRGCARTVRRHTRMRSAYAYRFDFGRPRQHDRLGGRSRGTPSKRTGSYYLFGRCCHAWPQSTRCDRCYVKTWLSMYHGKSRRISHRSSTGS